jgi:pyruvate dehydrogenase E1 component alpha subunit
MQKKDLVSVVFFGDGAANQGTFHESLNLAALWTLPVVFVCHDNRWAVSVPKAQSTAIPWNADRASAYGIPGVVVDGMDAEAVYEAAAPLIQRARRGEGASLLEATCYRFRGHFETDPLVYLPPGEMEEWKAKDPIPKLEQQIVERGYGTQQDLARIREEIQDQVEEAAEFALASPWPEPELATQHVFA